MAEDILKEVEQVYSHHIENTKTTKLTDKQKWANNPAAYHVIKNDISKEA